MCVLYNEQCQGPLYLIDVCVKCLLPAVSCTSTAHTNIIKGYTVITSAPALIFTNSRDLGGNWDVFWFTNPRKNIIGPAETSIDENLEHVKKLCIKFQCFPCWPKGNDEQSPKRCGYASHICLWTNSISDALNIYECIPWLRFSAVWGCGLLNNTSCYATQSTAVWKLPASSL